RATGKRPPDGLSGTDPGLGVSAVAGRSRRERTSKGPATGLQRRGTRGGTQTRPGDPEGPEASPARPGSAGRERRSECPGPADHRAGGSACRDRLSARKDHGTGAPPRTAQVKWQFPQQDRHTSSGTLGAVDLAKKAANGELRWGETDAGSRQ